MRHAGVRVKIFFARPCFIEHEKRLVFNRLIMETPSIFLEPLREALEKDQAFPF